MTAAGRRFVGRIAELTALRAGLTEALAGLGRMTVLRGEPGIGKTRLAEELAAVAALEGVPAVWGRCSSDAGAPPLWPLRRILDQLPGRPAWPSPADGFGASTEGSAAARFAQSVWFADAVVTAAQPAGLLVVVEDLHWADSATVSALAHLAAEAGRSRALVLVTARPRTDVGTVAELLDRREVVQHHLPGLDRDEVAEYLGVVSHGRVDERYVDLVVQQTTGNSLYVVTMARVLAQQVSLTVFDAEAAQAALAGRPELVDLVREPMTRVSPACRELVEAAAVAGDDFDVVEVATACGLRVDVAMALLDEAVSAGLVARRVDEPGTARFVHALVRGGVYDAVDRGTRSRLHRGLATAVAAADDGHARVGVVAGHLARGATNAAGHVRAAAAARRAGHAALADLAYAEAATHFRSALHSATVSRSPSSAERAETLLDLALAEYRSGAFGAASKHCGIAADLAEAEGRWELLARAALLVDGVDAPEAEHSVDLRRRALAHVPDGELSVQAQLEARLAYSAAGAGDLAGAERMSRAALALAEQTAEPAALMAGLRARHLALAGPSFVGERLELAGRTLDLAERGEPLAALWGRLWRIDAAFELGDLVAVDREIAALARTAAELRFPLARWHLARLRAAREALVGRFAQAIEQAQTARRLTDEIDDPTLARLYFAFVVALSYTRGRLDHEPGLDNALQTVRQIDMPITQTSSALALTLVGDTDEATRLARRLCAASGGWPLDGRWVASMTMLANVVADVADASCADVLYPMLAPFAHLAVAGGAGTVASDGSVSRHLGRLAATSGRLDVAERHLRDAITAEERMAAAPFAALSRLHLAEALSALGGASRRSEAARTARTALTTLDSLDMPGRAASCRRLVTEIEGGRDGHATLTPREDEIVGLVADGLSNRQVAERLFLSERTVETHVSHVLAKLGGSSRADIVAWVLASRPP